MNSVYSLLRRKGANSAEKCLTCSCVLPSCTSGLDSYSSSVLSSGFPTERLMRQQSTSYISRTGGLARCSTLLYYAILQKSKYQRQRSSSWSINSRHDVANVQMHIICCIWDTCTHFQKLKLKRAKFVPQHLYYIWWRSQIMNFPWLGSICIISGRSKILSQIMSFTWLGSMLQSSTSRAQGLATRP